MVKQIGLTAIVLVLLMTTVEIKGGNRYNVVMTKCCRKSVMNPSMASLSPSPEMSLSPSPSESPLTIPLIASPANSPYLVAYRGGAAQLQVTGGTVPSP